MFPPYKRWLRQRRFGFNGVASTPTLFSPELGPLYSSNAFPRLTDLNSTVTSPATHVYNCIAWAAEDDNRWWWPVGLSGYYWPTQASFPTPEAFREVFGGLGYVDCADDKIERRWEKIAFYVDRTTGFVTHAARQLSPEWTSKLGNEVDIRHDSPEVLAGGRYGEVAFFMKRRVQAIETQGLLKVISAIRIALRSILRKPSSR